MNSYYQLVFDLLPALLRDACIRTPFNGGRTAAFATHRRVIANMAVRGRRGHLDKRG